MPKSCLVVQMAQSWAKGHVLNYLYIILFLDIYIQFSHSLYPLEIVIFNNHKQEKDIRTLVVKPPIFRILQSSTLKNKTF